jgi:hypothetical protein
MSGGSNCVEVRMLGDVVHVRDSKNPTGPSLAFTTGAWADLLAMLRVE